MALSMVVIAALVGAGGLGRDVLVSSQRLNVGQALEAGLAIALLAVLLDWISVGFYHERQKALAGKGSTTAPKSRRLPRGRAIIALGTGAGAALCADAGGAVACPGRRVGLKLGAIRLPALRMPRLTDELNLYQVGDLPISAQARRVTSLSCWC